jgi:hypothetical protein
VVVVVGEAVELFRVDAARLLLPLRPLFLRTPPPIFLLASQPSLESRQLQLFATAKTELTLAKVAVLPAQPTVYKQII